MWIDTRLTFGSDLGIQILIGTVATTVVKSHIVTVAFCALVTRSALATCPIAWFARVYELRDHLGCVICVHGALSNKTTF
jgi:hypothetical protein